MALYRKKPVVVEAVLANFGGAPLADVLDEVADLAGGTVKMEDEDHLLVEIPGGASHRVPDGHYLIKGPGGLFVMEAALFEAAYEPAEAQAEQPRPKRARKAKR